MYLCMIPGDCSSGAASMIDTATVTRSLFHQPMTNHVTHLALNSCQSIRWLHTQPQLQSALCKHTQTERDK